MVCRSPPSKCATWAVNLLARANNLITAKGIATRGETEIGIPDCIVSQIPCFQELICNMTWSPFWLSTAFQRPSQGLGYLFPCSPEINCFKVCSPIPQVKIKILISYVLFFPKLICSPVPLIFRPLLPCFPEISTTVPLFPKATASPELVTCTNAAES